MVETPNIHPFLAAPIAAKLCSYIDIRDNLSLNEVADLNEILIVQGENERRAYDDAAKGHKK